MPNPGNTRQGNTKHQVFADKPVHVFNSMLNRQAVTAKGIQAGNNEKAHGQHRPSRVEEGLAKNGNAALVAKAKKLLTKVKGKGSKVVDDAKAGYKGVGKKGRPRQSAAAQAGQKAKKGVNWAKENPGKATAVTAGGTAAVGSAALATNKKEKKAEYIFNKLVQ